ncbi:MAG: transporter [Pontiella sp.]
MFKIMRPVALLFLLNISAMATEPCLSCNDACGCTIECACNHEARAPIGVMGDHVHTKGSWMVSYRYMFMNMDSVDGDLSGYMMKPVSMDMQMHMVGAMYTPTDNVVVGLMLPYKRNMMDMLMGVNPMTVASEGFGDLILNGTYRAWGTTVHQLLINLGIGLPTGSIDEENSAGNRMPYPMQLGSGSYALIPGITYTGLANGWGWGAQGNATVQLDENKHDYRLGEKYTLSGWALRDLCKASAISLRLKGTRQENVCGVDTGLIPSAAMSPLADPNLRAGTRLDLLAGIDYRPSGKADGLRLALEGGVPIYQELNGPQLKTDWMITGGLQFQF